MSWFSTVEAISLHWSSICIHHWWVSHFCPTCQQWCHSAWGQAQSCVEKISKKVKIKKCTYFVNLEGSAALATSTALFSYGRGGSEKRTAGGGNIPCLFLLFPSFLAFAPPPLPSPPSLVLCIVSWPHGHVWLVCLVGEVMVEVVVGGGCEWCEWWLMLMGAVHWSGLESAECEHMRYLGN